MKLQCMLLDMEDKTRFIEVRLESSDRNGCVIVLWENVEPGRWTTKQTEPAILKALCDTFDLDDEIAFEVYDKMGDAFSNFKDIVGTVEV